MPSRQDAERAILDLLAQRDEGRTICPSEAARALGGADGFRPLMPLVRDAAADLVARGELGGTLGRRGRFRPLHAVGARGGGGSGGGWGAGGAPVGAGGGPASGTGPIRLRLP